MRLSKESLEKYADGTTYTSGGKRIKRVSFPNTQRAANYCARSSGQKQTEKVQVRRKAWGCNTITGLGNPSIIKCSNCNWTWLKKDGGSNPYLCHKCNYNNIR
jgi:hypothetical protein